SALAGRFLRLPASAGTSFATSFSWWYQVGWLLAAGFSRLAHSTPSRLKPAAMWVRMPNHQLKLVAKEEPAEAGNPVNLPGSPETLPLPWVAFRNCRLRLDKRSHLSSTNSANSLFPAKV